MRQMTEKTMRQANGGYFRRGVQARKGNGEWKIVYNQATFLPDWSFWANRIRNEANNAFTHYQALGYQCKYF